MGKIRRPTVGDLFSGAGLLSHAFASEGAQLEFAIELDPWAAASYARNVGDHVRLGTVEKVLPAEKADIVIAGPPCQGFSTLGRRDPKDERNRLCMVVPKWAKTCGAQVAVVENVPPFLDSTHWRRMRNAFVRDGFEVTTWCLDAAEFGVPQRRRRSFTIASKVGLPAPPKPLKRTANAGEAFRPIPKRDPMHIWPEASELMMARMHALPLGGDRRDLLERAPHLCPPSWEQLGCQATDVWGRIDPQSPANTIRCDFQNPSKGRYVHPNMNRMISLREGARLQQIPNDWIFEGHRTAITRQIGNGIPVGLGRAVARQVLEILC